MQDHERFVPAIRDLMLVAAVTALVFGLAAAATHLPGPPAAPAPHQTATEAPTEKPSSILSVEGVSDATPSPTAHAVAPSSSPFDHDPREFLTDMTAVTHRRGLPVASCRANCTSE